MVSHFPEPIEVPIMDQEDRNTMPSVLTTLHSNDPLSLLGKENRFQLVNISTRCNNQTYNIIYLCDRFQEQSNPYIRTPRQEIISTTSEIHT